MTPPHLSPDTGGSLTVTYARGDRRVREKMCVPAHISWALLPLLPHIWRREAPEDHTSASETERTPDHAQKPQLAKSLRYADYV